MDNLSQISMFCSTAQEYLIKNMKSRVGGSFKAAHQHMLAKCLTTLIEPNIKSQVNQPETSTFLLYAAMSWPYHLELTAAFSDEASLILLVNLFRGSFVLTWVHFLAIAGQLRTILQASKILDTCICNTNKLHAARSSTVIRPHEKELLVLWVMDLIRIVGKFGLHLSKHPTVMYELVPLFCPSESIIFKQSSLNQGSSSTRISGFSNTTWEDCLAKFPIEGNTIPFEIVCPNEYFSVLMSDGVVILHHSSILDEAQRLSHRLSHGEHVLKMCRSTDGECLITWCIHHQSVECGIG